MVWGEGIEPSLRCARLRTGPKLRSQYVTCVASAPKFRAHRTVRITSHL